MTTFSQRKGLKPVKSVMQIDAMDADLRNSLWNALTIYLWEQVRGGDLDWNDSFIRKDLEVVWNLYFKRPLDTLNDRWSVTYKELREYFFICKWYEIYDFVEFLSNNSQVARNPYLRRNTYGNFESYCNSILEREVSGYRFVGGKITQITSETEISEIEKALDSPLEQVNIHLKTALDLLSNRKAPDYRNSIKESISAVEAACKLIANKDKATLDEALKTIVSKVDLHPALQLAFSKLYGYTNDADGIRHALLGETNLSFEDAKFMLVSCSAFVNYLVSKAGKAGIKSF